MLGMRSPRSETWDRLVRGLGWLLAIGLSAWAVGGLLSAYHFHQVQSWGWVNTIIIMPLIWLVMVVGLFKTLLAAVAPWVAGPLGVALAWLTDLLIDLVELMAHLPAAAWATPAIPALLVALGLMAILVWTWQPLLRIPQQVTAVAGLAFLAAAAWWTAPPGQHDALTIHVLAVGSGTTTVLQLPNAGTILYDVGCFPPYDLEKWTLGPLLSRDRCWRVDAVLLSHANVDHYAGLPDLIKRRWVDSVITTPHFEHAGEQHSTGRDLVERLRRNTWHRVVRGDRLSGTAPAEIEVLWPPAEEINPADTNDTSLVLRVTYAGRRILLCGDIEEFAIRQLLGGTDLRADVLLLPHHGSVTPSTAAFIRAVDPQYCIRSTHRRDAGQSLHEAVAGRKLLSTADLGAIEVNIRPGRLVVSTQNHR